jgi:hypothetical protein
VVLLLLRPVVWIFFFFGGVPWQTKVSRRSPFLSSTLYGPFFQHSMCPLLEGRGFKSVLVIVFYCFFVDCFDLGVGGGGREVSSNITALFV